MADYIKKAVHLGGTLLAVTAVTGIILGVVEHYTSAAIKQVELAAKNEAFKNVMPIAQTFEAIDKAEDDFVIDIVQGKDGDNVVGWCMTVETKSYGGPLQFIAGITKDGAVKAINILSHSDTPGLGARATEPEFYGQFTDKTALPLKVVKNGVSNPDEIAAISGATITSTAVTDGVNAAVEYWSKNLK
ncbi:MAG: RnfABCDGE type electron transport complex subunit G [Synergistaceae bacterium]|nr:RnfABCDGE type electron transport complex subunit G [Synergistaceae bacterium]